MAPLHNNGRRSRGSHASRIESANCVIEIPCRKQVICLSAPVRFPAPGLAGRAARTAMVKIGQYFGTKRENENFPCTSRVVSLAVDMGARPRLGVTSLNRPLCASFNLSALSVRWGQTRQHSNSRFVDFRKPFASTTRFTKMHSSEQLPSCVARQCADKFTGRLYGRARSPRGASSEMGPDLRTRLR